MNQGDRTSADVRFEAVARDLARGSITRRTALQRLAGAAFGAAVATVPGGALLASTAQGRCPPSRQCDGKCCPPNSRCRNGRCRCKSGFHKCGKKCLNLRTDHANCGSCGHACATGQTCQAGQCVGGTPQATCGNGVLEPGELCDGANLNGQTCASLGFTGGTLACGADCTFNTSGCTSTQQPVCGNGTVDSGEQCDGANLAGQTCAGLGFSGGTLACSSSCTFDTSGCTGFCNAASDCPGSDTTCQQRTCINNHCGVTNANSSTTCAAASCSAGMLTPARNCDGAGTCSPASPTSCSPYACNGSTACYTSCSSPSQCAAGNTCSGGICVPVSCTGQPDGTPCDDGNLCTTGDTCQADSCLGGAPVACTPSDQCHVAGVCNPSTGVCTNPQRPNGTPCNPGTGNPGVCIAGACT